MRAFMDRTEESFESIIALDGDLGKVHYGALGFGGGRIIYHDPGAHTMLSRGVPNPNLAAAKDTRLIKTVIDVLEYLSVKDIEVDPLGSTEANVGIEKRHPECKPRKNLRMVQTQLQRGS